MRFKSLGSGSTGNAAVVQCTVGSAPTTLLIDCGFGLKVLLEKLETCGLQPEDLSAIFITHEHGDHVGCVQTLSLKYRIPVWMSAGTARALGLNDPKIKPDKTAMAGLLNVAVDGQTIDLGRLQVTPFTVPHDAAEPLQLSCTDGIAKLGVLTDLGHATEHVFDHLKNCSALLLEFNHDRDLLAASGYPAFLKQRVASGYGHLSNCQAVAIARELQHNALRHVVAAHLSQQTNRCDLVADVLAQALSCEANDVLIASADDGCPWLDA